MGIRSVVGVGNSEAFFAKTGGTTDGNETFRVVLVNETPGELNFRVDVSDLGDVVPRAVVVAAVDGQNQPITTLPSFSVELIIQ